MSPRACSNDAVTNLRELDPLSFLPMLEKKKTLSLPLLVLTSEDTRSYFQSQSPSLRESLLDFEKQQKVFDRFDL